ncbi:hypothetical protein T07_11874 [Trichinella nelsoni]|uniref:Uncharacterized protein n=1 Tax=Trichinella nelsoni TaxID=6336 RepID=A0A0V0SJQ1_9BILA|nr:hypothetical protein T07_11874 [Trichinella nelsoni]
MSGADNLQFVFLFWRSSFVMRMVDNRESHLFFPGTLPISCINRSCISYQKFLLQLHTAIAAPDRDFLAIFYIYPSYLRILTATPPPPIQSGIPAPYPSIPYSE